MASSRTLPRLTRGLPKGEGGVAYAAPLEWSKKYPAAVLRALRATKGVGPRRKIKPPEE